MYSIFVDPLNIDHIPPFLLVFLIVSTLSCTAIPIFLRVCRPAWFSEATLRNVAVLDCVRAGEERLVGEALLCKRDANAASGYESFHVGPAFLTFSLSSS